jgi:hypothetical protein
MLERQLHEIETRALAGRSVVWHVKRSLARKEYASRREAGNGLVRAAKASHHRRVLGGWMEGVVCAQAVARRAIKRGWYVEEWVERKRLEEERAAAEAAERQREEEEARRAEEERRVGAASILQVLTTTSIGASRAACQHPTIDARASKYGCAITDDEGAAMQASVRMAGVRRRYAKALRSKVKLKVNGAASIMQAGVRMRRAREKYRSEVLAAAWLEARLRMVPGAVVFASERGAAVRLQAGVRGALGRARGEEERAAKAAAEKRALLIREAGARVLQARLRGRVARGEWERGRGARVLQAWAKEGVDREKYLEKVGKWRGAGLIRAHLRRTLERENRMREGRAALRLQAMYRGHLGRARAIDALEGAERESSREVIKSACRMVCARRAYGDALVARAVIRAAARRFLDRRPYSEKLTALIEEEKLEEERRLDEERRDAARVVQAWVRCAKARAAHSRWQKRRNALKMHEAKGTLSRYAAARADRARHRTRIAAIYGSAAARGALERVGYGKKVAVAVVLQAAVRRMVTCTERGGEGEASKVIQRGWRGHAGRRRMAAERDRRERVSASRILQASARRALDRRQLGRDLEDRAERLERDSAALVDAAVRRCLQQQR